MITIYHNNKCSKSREALTKIEATGLKFKVIEYLKTPLTKEELKNLIEMLGVQPEELVRKKEPLYVEKFKEKKLNKNQWIDALTKNPILIERPIVVVNKKAAVCRPIEKLDELLG